MGFSYFFIQRYLKKGKEKDDENAKCIQMVQKCSD